MDVFENKRKVVLYIATLLLALVALVVFAQPLNIPQWAIWLAGGLMFSLSLVGYLIHQHRGKKAVD